MMHKNNVNNCTFWLRMLVKTGNVQACDTLQTFRKEKCLLHHVSTTRNPMFKQSSKMETFMIWSWFLEAYPRNWAKQIKPTK